MTGRFDYHVRVACHGADDLDADRPRDPAPGRRGDGDEDRAPRRDELASDQLTLTVIFIDEWMRADVLERAGLRERLREREALLARRLRAGAAARRG